ncbi:MAG: FAD-dependent oxidoreductase [Acidobacteriota bacterium]
MVNSNGKNSHVVVIFGGAVAGSEAARCLAEEGIYSIVFDMEDLPYGKIEYGLPKWHSKQRDKEEQAINCVMNNPLVQFVPRVKLGDDIRIQEVLEWNVSAVLLATGAWRDRKPSISGIEDYVGRGFELQNEFVSWFNQYHSPGYTGPEKEIHDGAIIIGGGLASIDVAKIFMLETTVRALKEQKGIEADLVAMEKKGIPGILETLGMKWEELGLSGCTLFYRRRACDMPLMPIPDNPDPDQLAKAEKARVKLLNNMQSKYLFNFEPLKTPADVVIEGNRVTGVVFLRTEVAEGRVKSLPGTERVYRAPIVVSSIGSLPEFIPGLSGEDGMFRIENHDTGELSGLEYVFALGNAVTGRGNIKASRAHGRQVVRHLIDNILSIKAGLTAEEIEAVQVRVSEWQGKVGYDGDYNSWVENHKPVRYEDINS